MRPWVLAALAWVGCGGAAVPYLAPRESMLEGTAQLLAATARHDAAAITALLDQALQLGGVWFEDTTCRRQFATARALEESGKEAFARCLARLPLQQSERTSSLPGVAVLTYAPGVELEARFVSDAGGPKLRWIGFVARTSQQDALPTVTQRALEALRAAGPTTFDDATRAALDRELAATQATSLTAWVKVCIDVSGAVTGVHPRAISSDTAKTAFIELVKQATFRPFVLGGQPAPVCAMTSLSYPAAAPRQQFPGPLAYVDRPHVDPRALEDHRIAGTRTIIPDDQDRAEISKRGSQITGSFYLCLDAAGVVDIVEVLTSTGLPRYDAFITRAMRAWRYKPYLVEGKPTPVCTATELTYVQRRPSTPRRAVVPHA